MIEPYLQALQREIALVGRNAPHPLMRSHTLYLGGGTPSLLSPGQVAAIVDAACAHLALGEGAEITIEANPETVTLPDLAGFRAAGVNRLSLGVQSSHDSELRLFRRVHTFDQASQAFRLARRAGFDNIGVDLIYGIPGQSLEMWRRSLDAVLAWEPDHLSLYSLSLEPGTPLTSQVQQTIIPAPDPDLAADMYDYARERLDKAGLGQYEISNWAKRGYECRHNRQYWLNRPFLGFGAGAHGAACQLRYRNVNSVRRYIARLAQDRATPFPLSPASDEQLPVTEQWAMAETLILQLRLVREGVDKEDFARRFGHTPEEVFGPVISELESIGLLTSDDRSLRLTERAYLIANRVFVRFVPD